MVMKMKDSKDLLESILYTVQNGQAGIRSALDTTMRPGLRKALEAQLNEYSSIESEAHEIAASRGWEMRDLEPASRFATSMYTRLRLCFGNSDSRLAQIMITENTRGMISGLQNLHQVPSLDIRIENLSQKFIDCANVGIRQMQGFL